LIIISQNFGAYRDYSRQVMDKLREVTPLVEQLSIDEAFLDVTGVKGGGRVVAETLQGEINQSLELPCSFGVASNKLVAKIANNIGKASAKTGEYPNMIKVIADGEEAAFLAELPIRELWGVGPKTAQKLRQMGVDTIGDIPRLPERDLKRMFGKNGADIFRRAQGIDDRPVETEGEAKSISKEITFSRDVRDAEKLRLTLRQLCDGVGYRVRKSGLKGRTVTVKLRWEDFTTLTRQTTLEYAFDGDDEIYKLALDLLERNWTQRRPVRLIGVGMSGFDETAHQLGLWDAPPKEENQQLQSALDKLKDRFGESAIKRGIDLKRNRRDP
jgi:nucleotidyltransferase/DNA polymerase involved in DNA repair